MPLFTKCTSDAPGFLPVKAASFSEKNHSRLAPSRFDANEALFHGEAAGSPSMESTQE
jgi:hypothetical protein